MFKTVVTIIRCRCGQELTTLQSFSDTQTGTRFMSKRCESCGEITVIRRDEAPASH
jgi:hypothetical protein